MNASSETTHVRHGIDYVEIAVTDMQARTVAGGTIVKPIYAFPGGRRFHLADPAGNELAVWSDRSTTAA
jgi:predicted enzyme related to lactoylglutathione lyase